MVCLSVPFPISFGGIRDGRRGRHNDHLLVLIVAGSLAK